MDRPAMSLGTGEVINANSRHLPLDDNSVDLIVTSPPYFALRSYQDGGEHYAGQVGDEATPAEFVDSLLAEPSGSLWVNLGDKYASSGPSGPQGSTGQRATHGIAPKSLIGVPWRYALRCIDEVGLILRAEVIWSKPNGLPESVTDRVRRSHEQWFHFTIQPRYFSAVDEIREPHGERLSGGPSKVRPWQTDGEARYGSKPEDRYHTLGKLPGSVRTVATEPLRVPAALGIDHFAAFPTEWPKRIIQGWSPAGVCVECGEGRRPVTTTEKVGSRPMAVGYTAAGGRDGQGSHNGGHAFGLHTITGYTCACPEPAAPTRPAVVLDPFGGTGTTAMVAKALGRHGISVDMSADYCRLAEWRTNDRDQLAKVLGIAKAEQQDDAQLTMFELDGGAA